MYKLNEDTIIITVNNDNVAYCIIVVSLFGVVCYIFIFTMLIVEKLKKIKPYLRYST